MSKTNAVMNFLMLRVSTILLDTADIREALNLKNADFLFSLSVGCVVGFFCFNFLFNCISTFMPSKAEQVIVWKLKAN